MPGISVVCHGARGSVPVSGPEFVRYGGGTTCYEIRLADDHRLLIDAGTGALRSIRDLPDRPLRFEVLLTHLHWDHSFALPFYRPLYDPRNHFDFYGFPAGGLDIEEAIDRIMRPPWFPVNFRSTLAEKRFHTLDGSPFTVGDLQITTQRLHHPDGVTGYRIERDGVVLVVATDVEHGEPHSDSALRELAQDADVLLYDGQYTPDQYLSSRVGWGHSTWREGVDVAKECEVGRLVLTSHDPVRTDDEIDAIVRAARDFFPSTEAAAEGMVIQVP